MERIQTTDMDMDEFARRGVGDVTIAFPYGVYSASTDAQPVNPLLVAPRYEPNGGFVYFGSRVTRDDFLGLCRTVGISETDRRYAAGVSRSQHPGEDGYLVQMRLVRGWSTPGGTSDQELSVADALYVFVEDQQKEWGTSFTDRRLDGLFGGDGDFARDELAFGLMIENDYLGIYRIWSRAWLVTK